MPHGNKKWFLFCLLTALFILSRILFILFIHPIHSSFWGEELHRGVLAREIATGRLSRPFFDYQADHYSGGSLVVGLLAVPFFLFFGPSLFALRLVEVTLFTSALIVWIIFCLRFFNRNVAIIFSILFTFSPVFFAGTSVLTMGFHLESIFFTAVTIFIFYEIFFKQKKTWPYFAILGTICGFSLWFTYIFGITLLSCFLCWLIFERKFLLSRDFRIFTAGLLLGFSPWIYYNLTHRFQGLNIVGIPLHRFFVMDNLLKIFDFKKSIFRVIPASLGFSNFWIIDKKWLSGVYFLVFIVAFVFLLWKIRKKLLISKESFFILYSCVFCIAFQLAIVHAERYVIPLCPFIFMIIALFFGKLIESRGVFKKATSFFLISLLTLMSIASNIHPAYPQCASYSLRARGFSYFALGVFDAGKSDDDISQLPRYISFANNIDAAYRNDYIRGFTMTFSPAEAFGDFDTFVNLAEQVEKKYRKHFYCLIGYGICEEFKGDIDQAKALIRRIQPEYRDYVYEAWVDAIARKRTIDYEDKKIMVTAIDKIFYPVFHRQLGYNIGLKYSDLCNRIDGKYLPCFFEGVGRSIAQDFFDHPDKVSVNKVSKAIDARYQPFVLRGIGQRMALLVSDDPANMFFCNELMSELPPFWQKYCRERFREETLRIEKFMEKEQ